MEKIEINNDIQEAYCSFEVSKLLKEKGMRVRSADSYSPSGKVYEGMSCANIEGDEPFSCRYTHALAIEWIRVNFGIWIWVNLSDNFFLSWIRWNDDKCNQMCINNGKYEKEFKYIYFDSPHVATEAALLYTLKNLIN